MQFGERPRNLVFRYVDLYKLAITSDRIKPRKCNTVVSFFIIHIIIIGNISNSLNKKKKQKTKQINIYIPTNKKCKQNNKRKHHLIT